MRDGPSYELSYIQNYDTNSTELKSFLYLSHKNLTNSKELTGVDVCRFL